MSFGIAGEDETFGTLEELMAHSWAKKSLGEKIWCQIRRRYYWWFRNPIRDARLNIKWAWQRVFRGWDDISMWSIKDSLSKTLGAQLVEMARISHGCPPFYPEQSAPDGPQLMPEPGNEVHELWRADLRKHGEALLAYSKDESETTEEELALYVPAQEALRWVADNLGDMWD